MVVTAVLASAIAIGALSLCGYSVRIRAARDQSSRLRDAGSRARRRGVYDHRRRDAAEQHRLDAARARERRARSRPRRARSRSRRSPATSCLGRAARERRSRPRRASSTPRSSFSSASWVAISSRPSASEPSIATPALSSAPGSYGSQTATGSHTVDDDRARGASSSPATAIATSASSEPSKQSSSGRGGHGAHSSGLASVSMRAWTSSHNRSATSACGTPSPTATRPATGRSSTNPGAPRGVCGSCPESELADPRRRSPAVTCSSSAVARRSGRSRCTGGRPRRRARSVRASNSSMLAS